MSAVAMTTNTGSVLTAPTAPVLFDPANKQHRMAFAQFIDSGRLPTGIRFEVERPYTTVVSTIQAKLTHWALRNELAKIQAEKIITEDEEATA